ncbi:Estrogen-related receptor gamma [Hypsibius exemplaris]|uniref:Estrogen-related receptor gamma n=1 Tax=Hypsibius exemplaris TaxID=2072580 RepID=A0A1W0WZ89_HYPEX|nr:Estrogen-related receptor gamma [Hypsibius exemplaris]
MYKHRYSPQRPSTIRYTGGLNSNTNNSSIPSSSNSTSATATPSPESSRQSPATTSTTTTADEDLLAGLQVVDSTYHRQPQHESTREDFSMSAADSSSTPGLCQELKNRWEKASTSSAAATADHHPHHGSQAFGETRFSNGFRAATSTTTPAAAGKHEDISKVTGTSGQRPSTRWTASFHNRRTASEAELDGAAGILGGDEESNSSAPESFQHGPSGGGGGPGGDGDLGEDGEMGGRKRRCLVCDDSASGYHYGVSSCEACKAFFKRTIQGNIEYACPAINICPIDKRRRKACQACRYKKCLSVGMLKEGVRLDRVRGGRQKYRRANNGDPIMVQTPLSHQQQSSGNNNSNSNSNNGPNNSGNRRNSAGLQELSQLLTALLACEPDTGSASVTDHLDTPVKLQSVLCDLADRDLVGIIGWAKQIPGFPELPLNDQMHLLQSTWCEILLFSLCVRSIETPQRGQLLFAEDFPVDEAMAQEAGFEPVHGKACRLVDALKSYRIAREEYVLIKCIILLNGGCVLESTRARDALRDTIVGALHQFVEGGVGGPPRSGNLLLLLPHLRQLDGLAKQYWFMIKNDGKIAMHKLFLEMLDSAQQLT